MTHFYECFCEVVSPATDREAWIIQKYPDRYNDEEVLKSVPKFAYPYKFTKYVPYDSRINTYRSPNKYKYVKLVSRTTIYEEGSNKNHKSATKNRFIILMCGNLQTQSFTAF